MESKLDPGVLYTDIERGITETDIDVVSDLWEMDGREVYRGVRDPRYTHANVFWLYDETLERVGLAEHSKLDHAVMHLLWYQDSDFGTLLQEEGWESTADLWSLLPQRVFDRCVNEGWTTVRPFLEHCLGGPMRIVTPSMVRDLPMVYTCSTCGSRRLSATPGCSTTASRLDFPRKKDVVFVDDDLSVHVPPPNSTIWARLGFMPELPQPDDGSLPVAEPELSGSAQ